LDLCLCKTYVDVQEGTIEVKTLGVCLQKQGANDLWRADGTLMGTVMVRMGRNRDEEDH
jgi:hypothetical protein